tara:strand:- start:937 stop:1440 length:504 start_codon:yes stop_codon:yes gene_type:complete
MSDTKQKIYVLAPLGETELSYIKEWDDAVSEGKVTLEAATKAILELPQLSLEPYATEDTLSEISQETVEEFADTVGAMVHLTREDIVTMGEDFQNLMTLCYKEEGTPNTLFYSKEGGLSSGPLLSTNTAGLASFAVIVKSIYISSAEVGMIPSMIDLTFVTTFLSER